MTTPATRDEMMPEKAPVAASPHPEDAGDSQAALLNKLRAAVLGANDGVISTAGLVMGVAGATTNLLALATAGIAGLVAGALSMAAGEYVSVSAQRDSERALLAKESHELATMPEEELAELADLLQRKGMSEDVAKTAAQQLMDHDALGAHADLELGIDQHDLVSPWAAAISSLFSFSIGALIPLLAMLLAPADIRVGATVASVLLALFVTGFVSARVGGAPVLPAIVRNILGGFLAMAVTFGIGTLVGTQLG